MNAKTLKAFTLIEIMVVLIIIGVMMMLAVPRYTKTIDRARLQDAINQLIAAHSGNMIYRAQSGAFLGGSGDHAYLNSNLGINIIPNGMTYAYTGNPSAGTFSITATWGQYTVTIIQGSVSYNTNPTCTASSGGDACPPP